MNFDDFYGLSGATIRLVTDIASGKGIHAYLFSGIEGTGKRSMAEICARAIHCAGAHKPCDECPSCKRFLGHTHPDHILIEPKKSIGVEEIRALVGRISIKPFEGGCYTILLQNADKMTLQAQNALLKTLETPPGNAVFFLTTEAPSALLDTIRSRCRPVRFAPIDTESMIQALARHGIDAERASRLAREANGSVGQALRLHADETYWPLYDRVHAALGEVRHAGDVPLAAMRLSDCSDQSSRVLQIMERYAREQMRRQASPKSKEPDGETIDGARLLAAIQNAKMRISSNVRWQYVLETLFFDIIGGNTQWPQ